MPRAIHVALLGTSAIGTAFADTSPSGANALRSGVARCAAITDRDYRLTCYDALASQTASASIAPASLPALPVASAPAPAQAAPAATPPIQAESVRPEDFGLSPAQRGLPDKQITSITARVVGFARSSAGRTLIELDNGQSWELDEADPLLGAGDPVTIRRASLGSFLLTTPTKRTHRVKRTL